MNPQWPQKISPRVFMLGSPHFNCFLVGEDSYALIEAGMGCSAKFIVRQFRELSLDVNKLRLIIVMHAHPDHSAGIPYLLDAFPAAQVVASPDAQKSLAREKVVKHFMDEDHAMSEILLARGEIDKLPEPPTSLEIPVHGVVEDGDLINLGRGCRLEIYKTPGHSSCSISAFLPDDNMLFISDAGGFQTSPNQIFPIFFSGYQAYLDSLEHLKKFNADVLAIPHEQCHFGREAVDRFYDFAISEAKRMKDIVVGWLNQGIPHEIMIERIVGEHYRDNLLIYTPKNIQGCADSLIKRVIETQC
jgi:glyoxylase-like metal-dependent hydrolase (beta-lactamase superfamily II)